jgi:hypothetical protein
MDTNKYMCIFVGNCISNYDAFLLMITQINQLKLMA